MTKLQKEKPRGYQDGDEADFSDPEDFVDTISDQDLLGELMRQKPKESDSFDSTIVVDNIPQVGPERLEKLQGIVKKIFGQFGSIINHHYPLDQSNHLIGFIFLEFSNKAEAMKAVKATHGHKLDKQHIFAVNHFSEIEKYTSIPNHWEEPTPLPYKDHGNMSSWLLNNHCYDQFSVIWEGGDSTSLYLNTPTEPQCLESRKHWTEAYICWSPKGTYILTFHKKGNALWGGEKMSQIMKFSHPQVQFSDFSPCERYLVTFSSVGGDGGDDSNDIIIWDTRTGQKKRGFNCPDGNFQWPVFKWSHDGKFFARMTSDALSIYETPSFGLLEKKSLKLKDLKDFSWSPTDNIMAFWTGEDRDTPARVSLIEVPSRNTICAKNLFTVADCRMHWQKSGQYLCVKADRYKNKKDEKDGVKYGGITHTFNIFRIKEKEVPVDTVEIKDSISAFAWEPVGTKFAFIHGETPRICISFYNVKPHGVVECLKTFEKKSVNHLFWSPAGQFIVLAGLRGMNGVMEFVDTADMSVMNQAEHFMATDVEWDPTGRYVSTAVSHWVHKTDNAFWLWNFQGKLLSKHSLDRYCQMSWRPRPPSLLNSDQIKELKKSMKNFNVRFSSEDKKRETKASKEQIEKRNKLMSEYSQWRARCEERMRDEETTFRSLRIDGEEIDSTAEETVEFLVNVEEIPEEE